MSPQNTAPNRTGAASDPPPPPTSNVVIGAIMLMAPRATASQLKGRSLCSGESVAPVMSTTMAKRTTRAPPTFAGLSRTPSEQLAGAG